MRLTVHPRSAVFLCPNASTHPPISIKRLIICVFLHSRNGNDQFFRISSREIVYLSKPFESFVNFGLFALTFSHGYNIIQVGR